MYSATLDKTVRPICRKFCQDVRKAIFQSLSALIVFYYIMPVFISCHRIFSSFLSLFLFLLKAFSHHTHTHVLTHVFCTFMQPMEIFVDDDTKLTLHGLQQYYIRLDEAAKNRLEEKRREGVFSYVMSYDVTSCDMIQCHLEPCHVMSILMSCDMTSCGAMSCHVQFDVL